MTVPQSAVAAAKGALLCLLLACAHAQAADEVVRLKGSTVTGKVTRETDDFVEIRVTMSGASAVMRVKKSDIYTLTIDGNARVINKKTKAPSPGSDAAPQRRPPAPPASKPVSERVRFFGSVTRFDPVAAGANRGIAVGKGAKFDVTVSVEWSDGLDEKAVVLAVRSVEGAFQRSSDDLKDSCFFFDGVLRAAPEGRRFERLSIRPVSRTVFHRSLVSSRNMGLSLKPVAQYAAPKGLCSLTRIGGDWYFFCKQYMYRLAFNGRAIGGSPLKIEDCEARVGIRDLENDGRPEVLTFRGGQLFVHGSDGAVVAKTKEDKRLEDAGSARKFVTGDLDGDGVCEVLYMWEPNPGSGKKGAGGIVAHRYDKALGRLERIGELGNLADAEGRSSFSDYSSGDMDSDGRDEIMLCNSYGHVWVVDYEEGRLVLRASFNVGGVGYTTGSLADLDGDGRVELIQGTNGGGICVVRFGDDIKPDTVWSQDIGRQAYSFFVGDLNADGLKDIIVRHSHTAKTYPWRVTAFLGRGDMKWVPAWLVDFKQRPSIECADIDGNGTDEILVISDTIMTVYAEKGFSSRASFK